MENYTSETLKEYAVEMVNELMEGVDEELLPVSLDDMAAEMDWLVQNQCCTSKWDLESCLAIRDECIRRYRALSA